LRVEGASWMVVEAEEVYLDFVVVNEGVEPVRNPEFTYVGRDKGGAVLFEGSIQVVGVLAPASQSTLGTVASPDGPSIVLEDRLDALLTKDPTVLDRFSSGMTLARSTADLVSIVITPK
ncbi:MAG: hypothetical protein AB8H79_04215, partial [Myxococcota bacterium]